MYGTTLFHIVIEVSPHRQRMQTNKQIISCSIDFLAGRLAFLTLIFDFSLTILHNMCTQYTNDLICFAFAFAFAVESHQISYVRMQTLR